MTTDDPGTTVPVLSDFVIERSADTLTLSVSVAELLPCGSLRPGVPEMVAVFVSPVALAFTRPLTVYVIILPTGIVTPESFMSLLPVGENPAAPPVCVAVQVIPESVDGKLSVTDMLPTSDGPLLVTIIV